MLVLSGCVSYKPSMLQADYNPLHTKIHQLVIFDSFDGIYSSSYNPALIDNELRMNVMNASEDDFYGRLEIVEVRRQHGLGVGWICASSYVLCTLNILGMPIAAPKHYGEYDFIIYDIKDHIIAQYNYKASAKSTHGLYYGRGDKVVYVDMMKKILKQFHADMYQDADEINERLESAMRRATEEDKQRLLRRYNEFRHSSSGDNGKINRAVVPKMDVMNNQSKSNGSMDMGRTRSQIQADMAYHSRLMQETVRRRNELIEQAERNGTVPSTVVLRGYEEQIAGYERKLYELEQELTNASH